MPLTPTDRRMLRECRISDAGEWPEPQTKRRAWKPTYRQAIEDAAYWEATAKDFEKQRDYYMRMARILRHVVLWIAGGLIGALMVVIERWWR